MLIQRRPLDLIGPHARAVGNLVDKAGKYIQCQGAVSQRAVRENDGMLGIILADNGPGIPENEKSRVIQRFYRCPTDGVQSGIGLGLSVVEAVACLHEGSLAFADHHPGLRAKINLPAASA